MSRRGNRKAYHLRLHIAPSIKGVLLGCYIAEEIGSRTLDSNIHLLMIGDIEHRSNTFVIVEQSDIDGELVIALNELQSAIQRVDKQEHLPIATLIVENLAALLAQNRDTGGAEVLLNGRMGHTVRQCDRGLVALEAYVITLTVLIDFHYRIARLNSCIEALWKEMIFDLCLDYLITHYKLIFRCFYFL